MEKKVIRGYIVIMEKKTETTILDIFVIFAVCRVEAKLLRGGCLGDYIGEYCRGS